MLTTNHMKIACSQRSQCGIHTQNQNHKDFMLMSISVKIEYELTKHTIKIACSQPTQWKSHTRNWDHVDYMLKTTLWGLTTQINTIKMKYSLTTLHVQKQHCENHMLAINTINITCSKIISWRLPVHKSTMKIACLKTQHLILKSPHFKLFTFWF